MVGVRVGQAMEAENVPLKLAREPPPTITSPTPPNEEAGLLTLVEVRGEGRRGRRGREEVEREEILKIISVFPVVVVVVVAVDDLILLFLERLTVIVPRERLEPPLEDWWVRIIGVKVRDKEAQEPGANQQGAVASMVTTPP